MCKGKMNGSSAKSEKESNDLSFLCFGGVDWWYHHRAHIDPQLTIRFAKRGKTLYINSIVMGKFNFGEGRRFIQKLIRKTKSIFTGLKKTSHGFWVYSPFVLPVHHIAFLDRLNQIALRLQIWYVTRRLGIYNPVVLVANPAACDAALKLKKRKLIYQRTDRFEEAEGIDEATIRECDRKLKAASDLTIYVNSNLFKEEAGECRNAFFLDHGVDFEMFASAEESIFIPHDIADVPRPIAGYFGTIIRHSVDIALIAKIADLLPELSFVFVGKTYEDYPELVAKKNVWLLGQKDYEQIPHYGKCFDVAILPWVRNRWTEAANPIKVKEYLALGKPFVSTSVFTQIQEYLDVIYVADTPKEFAQSIVKALDENSSERIAERRKKVENATWDSKAELLISELFHE